MGIPRQVSHSNSHLDDKPCFLYIVNVTSVSLYLYHKIRSACFIVAVSLCLRKRCDPCNMSWLQCPSTYIISTVLAFYTRYKYRCACVFQIRSDCYISVKAIVVRTTFSTISGDKFGPTTTFSFRRTRVITYDPCGSTKLWSPYPVPRKHSEVTLHSRGHTWVAWLATSDKKGDAVFKKTNFTITLIWMLTKLC